MPTIATLAALFAFSHSPLAPAHDIVVYEDRYGVPSIVANSLKGAGYGIGYAQAKDHAQRMALNYKIARGRMAEVQGRGSLLQDGFVRGLGFESKAMEEAPKLEGETKEVIEAYLAGANKSLEEQRDKLPKWIEPFTEIDVISLAQFVNAAFPLLDLSSRLSPGAGSNQFALAPSRTATKHPILSIDPHLGWDGQDGGIVWQEYAMYTPDVHFRGVAIPGLPMGALGHNDHVAWAMTNNNPKLYTIYNVKTNPDNRNQYSYHGQWKEFKVNSVEMRYLENGELKSNKSQVKSTEWGPMVPFSNRSVRLSVPDPLVTFRQALRMIRSKSCKEFRNALGMRGISMWNYVYADAQGNIAYQYNAFVPKRDETVDWDAAVSGDVPKTEWGDLWSLDDLPNIQNPRTGILVNCNSNPALTPLDSEITKMWPRDVTSYGATSRWEMLSGLLKAAPKVSPEQAQRIATDCTVPYAETTISQLAKFVEAGPVIQTLEKWDKKATVASVGCALYTYWLRQTKGNDQLSIDAANMKAWTPEQGAQAKADLAAAAEKMKAETGSIDKRWGDIQYMQRGTARTPVQGFGYVARGSSIAAVCPSSAGGDTLKDGHSHATFGSSFRMIVSLDPKGIQSWSVLPYGNSNVSTSPHFADQMPLYAQGKYKPTFFGLSNAKQHSIANYHLRY